MLKEKPQSELRGLNQGASTIHFYAEFLQCPGLLREFIHFLRSSPFSQRLYGDDEF